MKIYIAGIDGMIGSECKNKLEKNPIKECLSIQKKFYPRLFNKFNEVADPRNSSYIDYSNRVMLGTYILNQYVQFHLCKV